MPARYVLSVLGRDRPGIVAAVSRLLADAGCNIEDSSMTILRGAFAMLLVIHAPSRSDRDLRSRLQELAASAGLVVHLDAYPPGQEQKTEGEPYTISVHGADHPGIVAAVTALLAEHRVNIVDLSTRIVQGRVPVYVMVMEVILPPGVRPKRIEAQLRKLSAEIACDISFTPVETMDL